MITKFKLFEYNEDVMNNLLDKINKYGKDSLSPYELELFKNEGEPQKHFESGDIIFDLDKFEDVGEDTIKLYGTISYHGDKHNGYFELSKEGGDDPMSLLHHFGEFEPNDDDWYLLDDLIQELEFVYTN
jgi:hypothetical protein